MTRLTSLKLTENNIQNILPISNIKHLKSLDLGCNHIKISVVYQITQIGTFYLNNNNIRIYHQ